METCICSPQKFLPTSGDFFLPSGSDRYHNFLFLENLCRCNSAGYNYALPQLEFKDPCQYPPLLVLPLPP